ncbi:kinase-like domain-containing protein [Mycena latifolia]|nr:kinase-like domain-containing protein [Mycena latifolia]
MFPIITSISLCFTNVASHIHQAHCQAARTVERLIERVVVVVVVASKSIHKIVDRSTVEKSSLAPTKTTPILLPATVSYPSYTPPVALYILVTFFGAIAFVVFSAALVKTSVIHATSNLFRKVFNTLVERFKVALFVVFVSLPLFVAGSTAKVYINVKVGQGFVTLHLWSVKQRTRRASLVVWHLPGSVFASNLVLQAYGRILAVFIAGISTVAKALGYGAVVDVVVGTMPDKDTEMGFASMVNILRRTLTSRPTGSNDSAVATGALWTSPDTWTPLPEFEFQDPLDSALLAIGEALGSGGFGDVVEADMGPEDIPLAIKRVRKHRDGVDPDLIFNALCSEIQVHNLMVDHGAFPTIYGAFEDEEHFYVAMDRGQCSFWDKELEDVDVAMFYAAQLVVALQELHKRGILHCDIKPDNLLADIDNNLMIIDYGLATVFDIQASAEQLATDDFPVLWPGPDNPHTIQVNCGTPGYVSPAVRLGPCSFGADFFAVGITLHFLITGTLPEFTTEDEWTPDPNLPLSDHERDFLRRMMSIEEPDRFETYSQLKAHPIWENYVDWEDIKLSWEP